MTDLTMTIAPKSDQLNADDLIGRSRTIKVTRVSLMAEADQPIAINFEGDNGKPYKPCKSMRRVLVTVWGGDGNAYAGRRMTLYRDDKVQFGGAAVGGIRISHVSDISKEVTMALTATRASRKPYTVKPLPKGSATAAETAASDASMDLSDTDIARLVELGEHAAESGMARLNLFWEARSDAEQRALKPSMKALVARAKEVDLTSDDPSLEATARQSESAPS